MNTLKKFWKSIKRNPVINAFLLAVGLQILHDWLANQIDRTNIFVYLSTVCMAVFAREFTVPNSEHEARVSALGRDLNAALQANYKLSGEADRNQSSGGN